MIRDMAIPQKWELSVSRDSSAHLHSRTGAGTGAAAWEREVLTRNLVHAHGILIKKMQKGLCRTEGRSR